MPFTLILAILACLLPLSGCEKPVKPNDLPVSHWLNDPDPCISKTAAAIVASGRPWPNETWDEKHQKLIKGFVINKFRGDIDILKPGFKKIKEITKRSVLGVIPMIDLDLPEEDSLNGKAKNITWSKKNLDKIESEIVKLSKLVNSNLNVKEIERMIS